MFRRYRLQAFELYGRVDIPLALYQKPLLHSRGEGGLSSNVQVVYLQNHAILK